MAQVRSDHAGDVTGDVGGGVAVSVHALGSIRVQREGTDLSLGGPRQRRLLAVLLLHRGAVVSVDRVAEAVFAGEPTEAAAVTLRSYVARLRRVLGEDAVLTRAPGYQLALPAEAVDVARFEAGVAAARSALQRQEPATAVELVRRARQLWTGPAYAEFADEEWAYPEAQRLAELRLAAEELEAEAMLAAGGTAEVVGALEKLRREHPLREGVRGLLMTAYYRVGRQADALAEYRAFREMLADELGIDPSPALTELEGRVLAQDPTLAQPQVAQEPLRGYRLGERLGTGRDGTVHAAALDGLDRDLVVKVLRPELADDPDFIRGFEATAHRVAALRHPGVAPLHDWWREPGAAYVVMPRQPGGTLRDRLGRGPLARHELRSLVERIGGALARAGSAGLVHGRVSPENVLYDAAGDPVLTDFWLGGPEAPSQEDDLAGLAELVRSAVHVGSRGAGGPAWNPDVDVVLDRRADTVERLVADLVAVLGDPVSPGQAVNPYQGLRAFDEADAGLYFGRAELVEDVVARLAAGDRMVLLVGASGTGKSSAVRAGVLPRLRAARDTADWFVTTMLPAGAPYAELAQALDRIAVTSTAGLGEAMRSDGAHGIEAALRRFVPGQGQLLLVIDQFEELFTLSSEEEQRGFLAALAHALAAPGSRLRLVATLRADYYDRPLAVQPFGSLVGDSTVAIPAMLPAEVEAAVVEPARAVGREVERALAAELVGAVASEPAALPALQFVLRELAARDSLTLAGYRAIGGLEGAIAARAEELYQALDDQDRALVRELFERLVVVGDGEPTRRRAARAQIDVPDRILEAWTTARLLTRDVHPQTRVPTVEVAHEALIREWPRLRDWLEADRGELLVLHRLGESARTWVELGRDPDALLRGAALEAAVEVAARRSALPETEAEYVALSREAAEGQAAHQAEVIRQQGRTNRRLKWQLGGIAMMLVLALVGGLVALDQRREAVAQRHTAVARELAAAANENLAEDPERSILLALTAVDATRNHGEPVLPEALEALHQAVGTSRLQASFPRSGGTLSWSPDDSLFLTEGPEESGVVDVRDAVTGKTVKSWKGHQIDVNDVVFGPDSGRVVTAGDDGALRVWEPRTGELVWEHVVADGGQVWGAAYSPDGRFVAGAWIERGFILVLDARTGRVVRRVRVEQPQDVAFSPDGERLVASAGDGRLLVVEVASGRQVLDLGEGIDRVRDVAWSPNGRLIAAATSAFDADVYDARTGRFVSETRGATGPVNSVDFSPDSELLAVGSDDGTARLYLVVTPDFEELLVLGAQDMRGGVRSAEFSSDGHSLMTGDWAITATKVWDVSEVSGAEIGAFPGNGHNSRGAAISPDGSAVWINERDEGADRDVVLRELATGKELQRLTQPAQGGEFQRLALDPSGELLAIAHADQDFVVQDTRTGRVVFGLDLPTFVPDLAWSTGGEHLAVVSDVDQATSVRVYDRAGKQVGLVPAEPGVMSFSVAFVGPDLVATTRRGQRDEPGARGLRLWNWRTGKLVRGLDVEADHVAASPDGRLLASPRVLSGGADVWDSRSGRRVATLDGHTGLLTDIAFSSDGRRVATSSLDGTARVWDARTGRLLVSLRAAATGGGSGGAESVAFSADGTRLLTTWSDGHTRVFTLDLDELLDIGRDRVTRSLTDGECRQYLHLERCPAAAPATATGVPQD